MNDEALRINDKARTVTHRAWLPASVFAILSTFVLPDLSFGMGSLVAPLPVSGRQFFLDDASLP